VIAANGLVEFNSAGQPVVAQYRFSTFGGTDKITIAGGSPVTAPSAYGKVGAGIVIESQGGGTLSAPSSYLVVGYRGNAEGTYSSSQNGWINPHAKKPKTPKPATVKIGSRASVSVKGVASVSVSCQGGSCSGTLKLSFTPKGKHKAVSVGSVRYTISAGKTKTLSISLSKAAKTALKRAKGKLKVTATAAPTSGKSETATVTLTQAKKKKTKR
jgi:hypothetical protein